MKIVNILILIAVVVLVVALVVVGVRANIAVWHSDLPWWLKFKLICR